MKKTRNVNLSKLSLTKETISNLQNVQGGDLVGTVMAVQTKAGATCNGSCNVICGNTLTCAIAY